MNIAAQSVSLSITVIKVYKCQTDLTKNPSKHKINDS